MKQEVGVFLKQGWMSLKQTLTRKRLYRIGATLLVLLVLSVLLTPTLVRYLIQEKIAQIEQRKHIDIELKGFEFSGFGEVSVESVVVMPLLADTLFEVNHLRAHLSVWQLLLFRTDLQSVSMSDLQLRFVKRKDYCNYNFLFGKNQTEPTDSVSEEQNYARRVSSVVNLMFRLLPADLSVGKLSIVSHRDELTTVISAENIAVKDHLIRVALHVDDNLQKQLWQVEAQLDKAQRSLSGVISSRTGQKASFPYINQIYQTQISFNELSFHLSEEERGSVVSLSGRAAFGGLVVNHPRLSPEDILMGSGALDYVLNIGPNYAELDSVSTVSLNHLKFHPYLKLEKNGKWHLTASVDQPGFSAEALFGSLPKGLFHTLENIGVRGDLAYHFLLDVDLNQPDSLRLESSLKKKNFALTASGELTKMNAPFSYTAYENDRPVRTFEVGPGNPMFRPLASVSPLLRQAVLQSEDGQFYFHRGFRLDALREALIYDIKVKRFARGGSTISMQLVKNVFLNRHKNIARKLEEALLVWLIEENRITTKDRMFEVYLNIAEWGPMIYGIAEASHFYFDKEPADLTLNEAIFLASIIPSPKRYASSFDAAGQLKQNRYWHFRRIAERLCHTGYITEAEKAAFVPAVTLTGVAKERISQAADSTAIGVEADGLLE